MLEPVSVQDYSFRRSSPWEFAELETNEEVGKAKDSMDPESEREG